MGDIAKIGTKIGRLTVLRRGEDFISKSGKRRCMLVCQCDCGNIVTVRSDSLSPNHTTSCGCVQKEKARENMRNLTGRAKHGESKERLRNIWYLMNYRCSVPECSAFKNYGGRGITVCEEWSNGEIGYCAFKKWATKSGYKDTLTLDRVDVNCGYSPHNCRWVPHSAQASNKRNNHLITYNGETHTVSEWSRRVGIPMKTLHRRIQAGWKVEDALTRPLRNSKSC